MTNGEKMVGSIATRNIVTIDADDSLENAGKQMDKNQVSMLVVTENKKIIGLLTAGDWFKSFYLHVGCHLPDYKFHGERIAQHELQNAKLENAKKRAKEFKQTKVRDIMNRHFNTISEDASLTKAVHEMKASDLRRLLVTDKTGEVNGVLGRTKTILELLSEL